MNDRNDEAASESEARQKAIIALLARSVIGVDRISEIVRRKKRNPEAYVQAYNRLDGQTTATQLARLVGVTQQTMSAVLQAWEEEGIVYRVGSKVQPKFSGLLSIPKSDKTSGRRPKGEGDLQ
ncbi:MAG: helix-turn-helix domain-containing protein [Terriglobales bacterium]